MPSSVGITSLSQTYFLHRYLNLNYRSSTCSVGTHTHTHTQTEKRKRKINHLWSYHLEKTVYTLLHVFSQYFFTHKIHIFLLSWMCYFYVWFFTNDDVSGTLSLITQRHHVTCFLISLIFHYMNIYRSILTNFLILDYLGLKCSPIINSKELTIIVHIFLHISVINY